MSTTYAPDGAAYSARVELRIRLVALTGGLLIAHSLTPFYSTVSPPATCSWGCLSAP